VICCKVSAVAAALQVFHMAALERPVFFSSIMDVSGFYTYPIQNSRMVLQCRFERCSPQLTVLG